MAKSKKLTKLDVLCEQEVVFRILYEKLCEVDARLRQNFDIARNMACSEWSYDNLLCFISPTKILPDTTGLLRKNLESLLLENSRCKYYLIRAFLPALKDRGRINAEMADCLAGWDKELGLKSL